MDKNQIFTTLSLGIVFTGIAAGLVEEIVFRGVRMSLIRERWNTKAAIEFLVMTYVLDSKSFAITGGEFGIEASVIALIGYTDQQNLCQKSLSYIFEIEKVEKSML